MSRLAGGYRLQPAHFEPARVPVEVTRCRAETPGLPVGSPGKVGVLELGFELRGKGTQARTELVHHYQKSPLQITKPLYYNPSRPDTPYTYLVTVGGGILHNDRYRTDLRFGEGTSGHVTTQSHTKIHRMEAGYATAVVNIEVAQDGYVEYLPDPVIPYADSCYYQHTRVSLHPTASVLLGEVIYAGRLGRDERNAFFAYASDLEVRRAEPAAAPLVLDRMRLVPELGSVGGSAVTAGRDIVGTLFVVSGRRPAPEIAQALHTATSSGAADSPVRCGVSTLPGAAGEPSCGAWLRFVCDDTVTAVRVYQRAAAAAHELLLGTPAPAIRK